MTQPRVCLIALATLAATCCGSFAGDEETVPTLSPEQCLTAPPTVAGSPLTATPPCNGKGMFGFSSGCLNPECTHCCPEQASWYDRMRTDWAAKSRGLRRWWYRHNQARKGLQHPADPPFCKPNWGYHPTCWRRFPTICHPCPPAGANGVVPQPATPPPSPTFTLHPAAPPAAEVGAKRWESTRTERR